jgi:hypothetical protein
MNVTGEFFCGMLVIGGVVTLVLTGLVLLARFVEGAGAHWLADGDQPGSETTDTHRLSIVIAEALMEHHFIEPGRFNEVAQIVALKIELQKALGPNSI